MHLLHANQIDKSITVNELLLNITNLQVSENFIRPVSVNNSSTSFLYIDLPPKQKVPNPFHLVVYN